MVLGTELAHVRAEFGCCIPRTFSSISEISRAFSDSGVLVSVVREWLLKVSVLALNNVCFLFRLSLNLPTEHCLHF